MVGGTPKIQDSMAVVDAGGYEVVRATDESFALERNAGATLAAITIYTALVPDIKRQTWKNPLDALSRRSFHQRSFTNGIALSS
jgi:hypothetical protein